VRQKLLRGHGAIGPTRSAHDPRGSFAVTRDPRPTVKAVPLRFVRVSHGPTVAAVPPGWSELSRPRPAGRRAGAETARLTWIICAASVPINLARSGGGAQSARKVQLDATAAAGCLDGEKGYSEVSR
jgi:hypothetical protein